MEASGPAGCRRLLDDDLSVGVVILALLLAMGWGALHSLSPGHGKTMVAAYLVGTRGTARHALLLGLFVTVTHTIGVIALGLVTLFASRYILPEDLYPWINLIAALAVVGIGASVAWRRLRAMRRRHAHDHAHAHEHDARPRARPGRGRAGARPGRRPLARSRGPRPRPRPSPPPRRTHHATGMDTTTTTPPRPRRPQPRAAGGPLDAQPAGGGGLGRACIPCPSALVLLLGRDRPRPGRATGWCWCWRSPWASPGLLSIIGLLVLYARRWVERLPLDGRFAAAVPTLSALVIVGLGVVFDRAGPAEDPLGRPGGDHGAPPTTTFHPPSDATELQLRVAREAGDAAAALLRRAGCRPTAQRLLVLQALGGGEHVTARRRAGARQGALPVHQPLHRVPHAGRAGGRRHRPAHGPRVGAAATSRWPGSTATTTRCARCAAPSRTSTTPACAPLKEALRVRDRLRADPRPRDRHPGHLPRLPPVGRRERGTAGELITLR